METLVTALGAFGVITLLIAFVWWLVSWGRGNEGKLRDQDRRIDELGRAVEDRERALAGKKADLEAERRALRTAERQRDEALNLAQALAAKSPGALTDAIRTQLQRLQTLVREVPADASAKDRGEAGAVHGPDAPD